MRFSSSMFSLHPGEVYHKNYCIHAFCLMSHQTHTLLAWCISFHINLIKLYLPILFHQLLLINYWTSMTPPPICLAFFVKLEGVERLLVLYTLIRSSNIYIYIYIYETNPAATVALVTWIPHWTWCKGGRRRGAATGALGDGCGFTAIANKQLLVQWDAVVFTPHTEPMKTEHVACPAPPHTTAFPHLASPSLLLFQRWRLACFQIRVCVVLLAFSPHIVMLFLLLCKDMTQLRIKEGRHV